MKKISIILYFFLIALTYVKAQNYSAKLRVEDLYWYQWDDNSPEWRYDLYADLYLDGVLVNPGSGYQYMWWKKIVKGNQVFMDWSNDLTTLDYNSITSDGDSSMTIYRYVVISNPNIGSILTNKL